MSHSAVDIVSADRIVVDKAAEAASSAMPYFAANGTNRPNIGMVLKTNIAPSKAGLISGQPKIADMA